MKKQHEQQWRCKLPPVFRSLIPRAVLWVVQLVRSHRAPRCEGALQRTNRGEQPSHHPGNDRERTEGGPAPYLAPGPRQLDGPAHTQYAQISHTRSSGGAAPWPRDFPARKTSWRAEEQRTDLWLHEDRQDKLLSLSVMRTFCKTLSEHDLKPTKQPQL